MMELRFTRDSDLERTIVELLPEIPKAARLACKSCWNRADRGETEDLCQQVVLLLIEADYRRLRSFDQRKSSLTTWLKAVIRHQARRHLRKQERLKQAEEVWVEHYSGQSLIETQALLEYRRLVVEVINHKLTAREKQFYEFLCRDDLPDPTIAELMKINPASVRRRRYALIRKIQRLVKDIEAPTN